jgi:protein-export membrane protein SecD
MLGLRDVIERRVNMFGVSEPVVQIQGQDRLVVELPGVADIQQSIQMIGQTPYLEFSEQKSEEEIKYVEDVLKQVRDVQAKEGSTIQDIEKIKDWQFALQGQSAFFKPTELTGKYLTKANVIFDQTTYKPQIQLKFNSEGADIFAEITGRNIKKPIAIFLDGASIIDTNGDGKIDAQDTYAPIVENKIIGGEAVITGNMSNQTATSIASRLNSGALPVKIGAPISQEAVGPTLGSISLQKSLLAGFYGLLGIIIFMIVFYRLPGLLASIAIVIYILINLSIFKLIPVTLTLAGIAGFLLSMGMALDANILIFARVHEELKLGKSYLVALKDGLKRAWPSIRDGNFTTILVGIILFIFGTSFVKGFAFTLVISNLIGMFTAIVITNYLLKIFLGNKEPKWIWLWR